MELALVAKKCQLDIVGLASMHSLGFGACRGAGLHTTSRVAPVERQRAVLGMLSYQFSILRIVGLLRLTSACL